MPFKVMLADPIPEPYHFDRFPVFISRKLDGVRATIQDGMVLSRSLKPIKNIHVQTVIGHKLLNNLDGELIVGDPAAPDVFRKTSSAVNTITGTPNFKFYVFDYFSDYMPFHLRMELAQETVKEVQKNFPQVELVDNYLVKTLAELHQAEEEWVKEGYEGVMIRSLRGPYKQGRSTLREGHLLKFKRFVDSEAVIIGVEPLYHNANEAKINERGLQERSSHKANLIPLEMMGTLLVRDIKTGVEFKIGSGFTEADRKFFWNNGSIYNLIVKYKSQPVGVKDKPRLPIYLGIRDAADMGE